jgi:hypothetical protein
MDHKEFAALGGKARAKKLSKQRRSEIAKAAVASRWAAHRENQAAKPIRSK